MIISASRRTDLPAFFSDWFINRLHAQYACVRNPMNIHHISKIRLSPDVVDCIVFWSKNPEPMMEKRDALKDYMYYFQFTLNGYDRDIEPHLPPLDERIETFQRLSGFIGKKRVIWRYDPVIINSRYSIDWHIDRFRFLAKRLAPYTEKVTISFIDITAKLSKNIMANHIYTLSRASAPAPKGSALRVPCGYTLSHAQMDATAKNFASIAHSHGLKIDTCAEEIDLSLYGIAHAKCIDDGLISELLQCSIDVKKDKGQRLACGCVESIDLGLYNTCQHGCIYCYANHNHAARKQNFQAYDAASPLLCSCMTELDKITERKVESFRNMQLSLFDMGM